MLNWTGYWKNWILFPSTKGMINKDSLEKTKDTVIILNTSRGPLIVDQDLADALNCGRVFAAGLDVVSTEPICADNTLLEAKNCLITPHISWAPKETRQRLMDIAVDNLKNYIEGNIINKVILILEGVNILWCKWNNPPKIC